MDRDHAPWPDDGLLVVDIQERLMPAMFERERVVAQALHLIRGASDVLRASQQLRRITASARGEWNRTCGLVSCRSRRFLDAD